MKKTSYIFIFFFVSRLFLMVDIYAQMKKSIVSPEIHKDCTVTFRFNAPNALKVELNAQFLQENLSMIKDEDGIWSVTTLPITPDLYPYSFLVDGVSIADPNNVLIFPNERFKHSLVDISNKNQSIYSVKDVPHGRISYRFYKSKLLNDTRPLVVYTPPEYNLQDNIKYPVLYLLHGATDTHETWFKVGRVNFILDNLIEQKKANPMIIVMPYANPQMTFSGKRNIKETNSIDYTTELVEEIIPYIEKNYKVKTGSFNRAIAGFSRGGHQALHTGFSRPDLFSHICVFAPAVSQERINDNFKKGIYSPPDILKSQLKFFWLGCGKEDFLYNRTLELAKKLEELEIPYTYKYTSGGHTWMNCRLYLNEIAQKIFNNKNLDYD